MGNEDTGQGKTMGQPHSGPAHERVRKLPVQQLTILSICRFADPIAATSLFPYLPEMVRSFGVAEDEVGKWAGICSAMFSLCQAFMGIPWGQFSDRFGRRPAILLGTSSTLVMTLIWGFSTSLPMAIVARGIAGAGSGNVGIIRTTVAEMVPYKELQPRAFSIMPLVWSVGSIFGPAFGGALANPYRVQPGEKIENPNLLQRYPYALPNMVAACFFLVGTITGFLFLEETMEAPRSRPLGLRVGDKVKSAYHRSARSLKKLRPHKKSVLDSGETEPLLYHREPKMSISAPSGPPQKPPTFREVLNKQSALIVAVYTLQALHSVAFDQLIPVYANYPAIGDTGTDPPFQNGNPLKFAGGLSLVNSSIGLLNMIYGICGMLIQFFIFPPVARHFGVLNSLKVCVCIYPIVYLLIPFTALLRSQTAQVGACFAVMLIKCFCAIFAIPCTTILLTNSAESTRVLGTLNGIATTFSALGRAAGPAIGGAMFTVGVRHGYIIVPWWTLCVFSIIAMVPVFYVVEGDGFGGDDGNVSDDELIYDSDEEDMLLAESEAQAMGEPGPAATPIPIIENHDEELEAAYGHMTPLAHTGTRSSFWSNNSRPQFTFRRQTSNFRPSPRREDSYVSPSRRVSIFSIASAASTASAEGHPQSSDEPSSPATPLHLVPTQTSFTTQGGTVHHTLSRRMSVRRIVRQTSQPIGPGRMGISRKYSSNLGQSFGGDH